MDSVDCTRCCHTAQGTDPAVAAALRVFEQQIDAGGDWDLPPLLALLVRADDGTVTVKPCRLPWQAYQEPDGRHYVAANRLAAVIAETGMLPVPAAELLGTAFYIEQWLVHVPEGDKAGSKHIEALTAERKLRTHPDRVEARRVDAFDIAGNEYVLVRERGASHAQLNSWGSGELEDYRGDLIESMRELGAVLRAAVGVVGGPPPSPRTLFGLN